jgi:hypothetical protein
VRLHWSEIHKEYFFKTQTSDIDKFESCSEVKSIIEKARFFKEKTSQGYTKIY